MKFFLVFLLWQSPPETQKYQEIDDVFNKMYNHSRLLSADKEAESMAKALLEKYPDNPYLYNLWASLEWLLIGRELNLRADEQREIAGINGYKERVQRYRDTVNKGLALTENSSDERLLFLRAALKFDHAKFSARYEGGLFRYKRADQEAAEGIEILREVISRNPSFCSAYLFLGGNRLQLSTKLNLAQQLLAWKSSRVYKELYVIDSDVINERKSVEWLEISYHCHYSQPWMKKGWLETNFLLVGTYRNYRKKLGIKDEIGILQKEVPLLQQLSGMFPQNQDIAKILIETELRLKILGNYFSKK